ncbi:MBL fold metallo-hydrolase [Halorientalis regularis]|jgi:L-ascorbate metabolism protein UlaG (beta-lactamase superfamily)|uniref:L-ascorbate metabolism protein UlaG, beta-lactamase superfamily n=1 Tax=Halorientalis regularis TaxID=660518 RepID=A0A1G7FWX9_9EURY|nr:MBL fold metallo-hydrolase [Halorientalis regularis]SDE80292.1 L-ascorbate metabolism protein UlaG, beta-lactamase superfamily [Halorientalis regularis]
MTVHFDDCRVDWLGYATVRIEAPDGTVVYLDPGRYGVLDDYDAGDADIVCVSHVHHYDTDGIERVARDDATVLVHEAVHHSETDRDVTPVRDLPYDTGRVDAELDELLGDVIVRTTAAYNHADGPHTDADGEPIHPEGFGCGFLLTIDGTTVFWPGDTDVLAGHAELDVDLFLPPIGGTFTMDREAAADLAEAMAPELVLPIHYDTFEAIEVDAEAFAADVAGLGVPVVLDG